MPANNSARKTPTFKKAPFSHMETTAELLGIHISELATQIGYDRTSPSGWRASGEMPLVAKLACDYLLHQHSGPGATLIVTPGAKRKSLVEILHAMGIPFAEVK